MSIRQMVLETLEHEYPYLQEKFGLVQLRLFGSVSRSEDTEESDIDLLDIFKPEYETYQNLFALYEYLTELFGRKVDLVSEEWSGERFLSVVLQDAVTYSAGGIA